MALFKLAIITSFLSGAVLATPMSAQYDARVGVCKHANFGEPCTTIEVTFNNCANVPGDYNDEISALQPEYNAGVCRFYRDYNCAGTYFDAQYPGFSSLPDQFPEINDQISSVKCFGHVNDEK